MAKITDFELSYGPTGSARGTISASGSTITLRGTGGAEYAIDMDHADWTRGLISIYDTTSLGYPLYQAGVGSTDAAGTYAGITHADSVAWTINDGTELVVTYSDLIGAKTRWRTHTYTVHGKAVKIRIEGLSTDLRENYSGVDGGAIYRDPALYTMLEAPGTLTNPTAYLTNGSSTETQFVAHFLDITQSNAQDFALADPAGLSLAATYSTLNKYLANDASVLPAPLGETLWCVSSNDQSDCFIHPNDATERHAEIAAGPWCFLTSKGTTWALMQSQITALSTQWGFDGLSVYPQWWWAAGPYTSGIQDNGSDWAAGDPVAQAAFGLAVRAVGFDVGVYSYSSLEVEGTGNYDASRRVLDSAGAPRLSTWGAGPPAQWMCKTEDVATKFAAQFAGLRDDLHLNAIRFDVDTYAGPTKAGGNYVDGDSTSSSQTLQTAIQERRRWMVTDKLLINPNGYAFGEGARIDYHSDFEVLWAGAVDSTHTWWSTNAQLAELDPAYPAAKTISTWPMLLTHAWTAVNPYFQHTNNNPDRFFTLHESGLQDTPPGPGSLYPYSRAMLDRVRCYALLLKRTGAFYLSSTLAAFMPEAQVVKEFYLTNACCRAVDSQRGNVPVIHYHDDANGYETENEKFSRAGRADFVETRARIVVGDVTIWVNRSATDWTIPGVLDSAGITLPTDGYFLYRSNGAYFGSFSSALSGGVRIDAAHDPGQYTLVDGRGAAVTFQGVTPANGLMQLDHYAKGFRLVEVSDTEITRTALAASDAPTPQGSRTTSVADAQSLTSAYSI